MGIYFDNSATSYPKPEVVYDSVTQFMRQNGASPGRGTYAKAMEADDLVYATRKALGKLLGVKRPGYIAFTVNATEAINLALKGYLKPGDRVLTTNFEHNAMYRPLKMLERRIGIEIDYIQSQPDGTFDLRRIQEQLRQNVRLLAIAHGSNVIGTITPLQDLIPLAHEVGAAVLVDTAQTAGVLPLHAENLQIDLLAFTGHKGLLGPTGTGGLCLREGICLDTVKEGGTGSMAVSPEPPDDPPDRYEAGTMNIWGLAGLRASAEYLLKMGVASIREHEIHLMEQLLEGLRTVPGIAIYGPDTAEKRLGLVSFNLRDKDPYKVAQALDDDYGIMVRAGLHCAPQAHLLLGTQQTGTVRASIGYASTAQEVETLIAALQEIAKL